MNWIMVLILSFVAIILIVMIGYASSKNHSSSSINIKVQSSGDGGKHQASTLVLSCMDYRFINDTIKYLNQHREGNFDYFVLAGASLGYNESYEGDVKDWSNTYLSHVDLAIKLHGISELIVVDHMDCGYYKEIYGSAVDTSEKEERKHNFNLHKFKRLMRAKYPQLKCKLLLAYHDDNGTIKYKEIVDV